MEESTTASRFSLRSLRARIILLALFACALLIAAAISFYYYLNSSQTARLDSAQRHLIQLATAMRSDYSAQLSRGISLQAVSLPRKGAPPPPPPPPAPGASPGPPPAPLVTSDEAALMRLTVGVLRREPDVEGGFYSVKAESLVAYAFPTHEGPGGRTEVPGKERPAIEELARKAAQTGTLQKQSFHGAHDAILFAAVPVLDGSRVTGAAWLMQRMPGLEAGRSKQLLMGSLGFAAAALTCALLTFFITSEVNRGVQTVLARLRSMEGSLDDPANRGARPQLREFQQVLTRVDALSASLKRQIETQRMLEDEVRHRQRLSALGQFAAGVAHELRNPLATIRLRTQMSQRSAEPSAVHRNCGVVLDEVDHLNSMIERLLYFSRPIYLQIKPVPLTELCRASLETWLSRCAEAGVTIDCRIPADLLANCDGSKVRQVIDNVLENALQSITAADGNGGAIEMTGALVNGEVRLDIRDNGVGLSEDAEAHALEPFFTTKDTGTGLGLSISYEIMQAHSGDLRLRKRDGKGAVATLILPATGASLMQEVDA